MVFLFVILGILLLLCLCGCIYFVWKLYISIHSTHGAAVVHEVIKEYRTYRPVGWSCKVRVRIMCDKKQIEKKLIFWTREDPIIFAKEEYSIPVLINISKSGKVRIMAEDKKPLLLVLSFILGVMALMFGVTIGLAGYSQKAPSVINVYEITNSELAGGNWEKDELVTMIKYYQMSDGTWKTDDDGHTYQYRLEITGRMGGANKDSTFVFLSNIKDITFEQAWKASGFSSNMDDYFKREDARFVAMK